MVLVLADERILVFCALKDISPVDFNGADLCRLMLGLESFQPRMSHDPVSVKWRVCRWPACNDGNHIALLAFVDLVYVDQRVQIVLAQL